MAPIFKNINNSKTNTSCYLFSRHGNFVGQNSGVGNHEKVEIFPNEGPPIPDGSESDARRDRPQPRVPDVRTRRPSHQRMA